MRVIVHGDSHRLEVEEQGSSVHIVAKHYETGAMMDAWFEWDKYPLFQNFRKVALELMAGVEPQLEALARTTHPASQAAAPTMPLSGQLANGAPPPRPPSHEEPPTHAQASGPDELSPEGIEAPPRL